jgi:ferrochelatase
MSQYPSGQRRIAVVLLRHGLPTRREEVQPYLQGLLAAFRPETKPWRRRLQARLAAMRWRAGDLFTGETGLDPILKALEEGLWDQGDVRLFQAPLHDEAALGRIIDQMVEWRANETLILPADPFYTPSRNGYGMEIWRRLTAAAGFRQAGRSLCCHPTDPLMLRSLIAQISPVLAKAGHGGRPQLLLVLPWGTGIAAEDPAQWQAERLAKELSSLLSLQAGQIQLCQLSLPGLKSPSALPLLDSSLANIKDKSAPLVILPFTPLPLNLQERLKRAAIGQFHLVMPSDLEMEATWRAHLIRQARAGHEGICSGFGARQCSARHTLCPYRSPALFVPPVAGRQLAAMHERA